MLQFAPSEATEPVSTKRDGTASDGGGTMSRRATGYCLSLAVVLLIVLVSTSLVQRVENRAELRWVASLTAVADWDGVERRLHDLSGRLGTRSAGRAGLALVSAIRAEDSASSTIEGLDAEDLRPYPALALLERALEERRFEGCLRLVRLLRASGLAGFETYEAAALLELRRIDEARAVELGAAESRTRLGRSLAGLLAQDDLERVPIRDRRGRLLGTLGPGGKGDLQPAEGVDPSLIPRIALEGVPQLEPTGGVRLTLDLEVSRQAQQALGRYYRGSIVVLDPESGDVLAAVSDPRTWREGGTAAFEQQREPASIAKLITVTAALRQDIDVDAMFSEMRCRGAVKYEGDVPLYCSAVNGSLRGLDRALAVSCNVAFAELGNRVGREALVNEYRRYGFDSEPEGGVSFGRVTVPYGTPRQVGELSIGLEVSEITPVHAALQAAAYGNGGWMSTPSIYESTDTYLGYSQVEIPSLARWRVVEEEWLPEIVDAMKAVVAPGGTAAKVAPTGFPIALKTGTASHPRYGFHVNYIGFGPLPAATLRVRGPDHAPAHLAARASRRLRRHQALPELARGHRLGVPGRGGRRPVAPSAQSTTRIEARSGRRRRRSTRTPSTRRFRKRPRRRRPAGRT